MNTDTNFHRGHFNNEEEHKKVNRYIEITCSYINLFLNSNMTILDVGAADAEMSKYLNGIYSGIDINPASNLVKSGDIFTINNNYDCLIFNHTLEHMPNTQQILDKAYSIINPNGYLFINVPIGEWAYNIKSHIILFNEVILKRNLENAGFKIIETSTHCFRENKVELWMMCQK